MTLTPSWFFGDLSFAWQAVGIAIAVVILILTAIVAIDLVQLFRAQPVGQLFPDGAEERSEAATGEIPYLLGTTPIDPQDVHLPAVKPLDKANFAASHDGTVIDIQTRKRA